jgi:hypothetical protein
LNTAPERCSPAVLNSRELCIEAAQLKARYAVTLFALFDARAQAAALRAELQLGRTPDERTSEDDRVPRAA